MTPEQLERKKAYNRAYGKRMYHSRPRTPEEKLRNKEGVKRYQTKNREKVRTYRHAFYQANKEKARIRQREWNAKNRTRINARQRENHKVHIAERLAWAKRRRDKNKKDFIAAYGGKCACCGEDRFEFLTGDHIGGRKKHGHSKQMTGQKLYFWLKKQGYPQDVFRLLCANCNCSHGFYGYCPHERERQAQAAD